jgi:hypothetical protein
MAHVVKEFPCRRNGKRSYRARADLNGSCTPSFPDDGDLLPSTCVDGDGAAVLPRLKLLDAGAVPPAPMALCAEISEPI